MSEHFSRFEKSNRLQRGPRRSLSGDCYTYAKGENQYPVLAPGFIERGSGSHVWDVDGDRFVEYGMGNRAVGLGHTYPPVGAVERLSRTASTSRGLQDRGRLCRNVPRPHSWRRNGEVLQGRVQLDFRRGGLARAYAGRDLITCCADHPFFSTDDWFIGTTAMNVGIPDPARRLTVTFRYNDIASANDYQIPGKIAALIREAARTEQPKNAYLREVQRVCHRNGALLILDETITGFRLAVGGAQSVYEIVPDVSCFGRALANGFFSVSALAGKRECMRLGRGAGGLCPGARRRRRTLPVGRPSQPVSPLQSCGRTGRRAAHGSEPVTWTAAEELRTERWPPSPVQRKWSGAADLLRHVIRTPNRLVMPHALVRQPPFDTVLHR